VNAPIDEKAFGQELIFARAKVSLGTLLGKTSCPKIGIPGMPLVESFGCFLPVVFSIFLGRELNFIFLMHQQFERFYCIV